VKVWDPTELPTLQEDVATTISLLEWELPGAFFDVMNTYAYMWLKSWPYAAQCMLGGCTLLSML